ncbi:hypothetical protein BKM31_24960 [[Actinomadura] parvosata subsp. kistnae]|uniref:prolyl aminopeptidase n=1 Tax=[Actinomadura] parvosata subsp. kistnae TaxID=1909395 RepID=A0A1V0A234_9ACTN|nr:hypothetical protein BKM31_24960 [Nonomuraea sp. ATCC 55076]
MVVGGLVMGLAPVAGLAALAGMALVGAGPQVFVVVGLAVFGAVLFLGLLLCVPRPRPAWGRWVRAVAVLGVEAAVVWQVGAATLSPPVLPPGPGKVAGQREWRLPTGSRLAYVRIVPERVTRPEPVIFLHGGPGVADLEGDAEFYGRLASAGFQVYVYDQLGAGRSARLPDPRGYGLARDVADLEAIRRTVRAERLNLVARDYGAQLAAAYLAAHPDRVARTVLYAPAGLAPARTPARPALSAVALGAGGLPHPRALAVATLLRVDPVSAHAFAGDRELDARLALLLRHPPEPTCPASGPAPGYGGYVALAGRPAPASLRTGSAALAASAFSRTGSAGATGSASSRAGSARPAAPAPPHTGAARVATPALPHTGSAGLAASAFSRAGLAGVVAPVLVVKGACDAERWAEVAAFRRVLPHARLAYVGDGVPPGRTDAYLEVLRTFLTEGQVNAYEGDGPPPGYRGP